MSKTRQSNTDYLKLLAMFMVIVLHALNHGGILDYYTDYSLGYYLFWLIESLSFVAVNCFVLVTGYYSWKKESFVLSKYIRFIVEVFLFSIICLLLVRYGFHAQIGLKEFLLCFFPITSKRYWFATSYFILIILAPFLNRLINGLREQQFRLLLLLFVVVFSIFPTVLPWFKETVGNGTDYAWFVVLYCFGAYLSKYKSSLFLSRPLVLYFFFSAVTFLSKPIFTFLSKAVLGKPKGIDILFSYNSITVFMASICLFIFFIKQNNFKTSNISRMSRYCFGAYLITDHEIIREPFWNAVDLLGRTNGNVGLLFVLVVLLVIAVMIVGIFLDYAIISILQFKAISSIFSLVDAKYSAFKNDRFIRPKS